MLLLTRGLPVIIELGLLIYCLINCIQTPADEVRNLPKVGWIVLIVLLPLIGSIAWLAAGRPQGRRGSAPWLAGPTSGFPEYERPRRTVAPDDDPDFLRELNQVDGQHEKLLSDWEEDLRRREQEVRKQTPPDQDRPTDA